MTEANTSGRNNTADTSHEGRDTSFMVWFALLMLLHVFLDIKQWTQQPKDVKRLYVFLYAVTLGLFVCITLGYKPTMPTQYAVEKVSPWIFSIIHPQG